MERVFADLANVHYTLSCSPVNEAATYEVIMARLMQTTAAKERVDQQAITIATAKPHEW
jgi:hypothetical protein